MLLGVWWRRLWLFLRRDRVRRELEEEMQLHRELRARAMERRGLAPSDAEATARRRFGHQPTLIERSQESWGFQRSDELRWNIRYALRRLANRRAYAAAIVLAMGLGIGATTALFSAVDAVMLRALPFREPNRLVTLTNVELPFAVGPGKPAEVRAALDLADVTAMPGMFSSVASYASGRVNLRDRERPLQLRVGVVTAGFFRTLGVAPASGRDFAPEESVPGATGVVILSDAFWRQQYGARDMRGKAILLDDQPYQVIGVMPRRFSFPEQSDCWIPMSVPVTPASLGPFGGGYIDWSIVARLAPGVELAAANSRLIDRWRQTIDAPGGAMELPEFRQQIVADVRSRGAVRPFQASLAERRARALLVLLGATGLLLLIACANVTNLVLSDAVTRAREMALRTALGASRGRLVRQVLTESTMLALGGVIAGLFVAPVVLRALQALLPAELAGVAVPRIDWRVLAFSSSLGLVTGIGFGLWPARHASRTDPGDTLKSGGNPLSTGRRSARGTRLLIVVEIALALMLLVGSGLLLRSFARLMGVERGMQTAHVASLELSFASSTPNAVRVDHIAAILERLRRTPGIESAAAVNDLPLGQSPFSTMQRLDPVAGSAAPPIARRGARYLLVSPSYFTTLGISLRRGRDFTPRDDSLAPPTVIVNEALVRRWFPNVDPVGRQLMALGQNAPLTVVGVVADVHEEDLAGPVDAQIYHPVTRLTPTAFALVARGRAEPAVLLAALENAVRAVDASQAIGRARMMDQVVLESVAPQRTNMLLISLFAGLALVLAALGVYSVVVHGMAQRHRELGIRTALGATGSDLLAMVSREICVVVAIGIAIGLGGAWAGSRVVEGMVYGVTIHDPASFAFGAAALAVIALTAAVLPLRRVFRVDPVDVIRND